MGLKIPFPISFGPVRVVPTKARHLSAFWEILQGWRTFWADQGRVETFEQFVEWYGNTAKDSLTGLDGDRVIGGAYLDALYPGSYATANVFKRKGYLNPRLVAAVVKSALPYWFEKYDLEAIRGITRHKATVAMCRRMGFHKDGKLRHWGKVDGKWTDYTILSILRGEL